MPLRPFSRLATVRQLAAFTIAIALGIGSALSLASCGGEDAELLPGNTAQEINENLDLVAQYAEEGECAGAEAAAAEVEAQVEALEGVDPRLKQALQRGADRLDEVVTTCEEEPVEAVEPDTEETTERGEPSDEEGKKEEEERRKEEEKSEKEAEKRQKEEEREDQGNDGDAPVETPPGQTPEGPPSEGGGTGAPGGISPGEPAQPEDG